MIRAWSDYQPVSPQPAHSPRVPCGLCGDICLDIVHSISCPGFLPKSSPTCHEKWRAKITWQVPRPSLTCETQRDETFLTPWLFLSLHACLFLHSSPFLCLLGLSFTLLPFTWLFLYCAFRSLNFIIDVSIANVPLFWKEVWNKIPSYEGLRLMK